MSGQLLVQYQSIGGDHEAGETSEYQLARAERAHRCEHEANAQHDAPEGYGGWLGRTEGQRRKRRSREQEPSSNAGWSGNLDQLHHANVAGERAVARRKRYDGDKSNCPGSRRQPAPFSGADAAPCQSSS